MHGAAFAILAQKMKQTATSVTTAAANASSGTLTLLGQTKHKKEMDTSFTGEESCLELGVLQGVFQVQLHPAQFQGC